MATYKNIPILQNADTIAEIPAYTQSLAESLSEEQDFISLTLVSPFTGYIELRKYGNDVHAQFSYTRSSGSATATIATIPAGWRPSHKMDFWFQVTGGHRVWLTFNTTGVITENILTASTSQRVNPATILWKIGS